MKQLVGRLFLLFVPVLAAVGQDVNGTSTVTFGLGAGKPFHYSYEPGGTQLNGTYEYRFLNHWALEFGVDNTIVKTASYSFIDTLAPGISVVTGPTNYFYPYNTTKSLATSMPFGPRFVLPLSQGKLELFAGGGGAYLWNPGFSSGWGWQADLGARLAIDKQRRFWLGSTGRYVRAHGAFPPQWMVWSADLGFRFGGR